MVPDSWFEIVPKSLRDLFFIQIESKLSTEDVETETKIYSGTMNILMKRKYLKRSPSILHCNCKYESKWQIN